MPPSAYTSQTFASSMPRSSVKSRTLSSRCWRGPWLGARGNRSVRSAHTRRCGAARHGPRSRPVAARHLRWVGDAGERARRVGRQRGQTRKAKPARAASRVAEEVLSDLLPDGPQRFPDAFLSPAAEQGGFREIILPVQPLRHAGHLWGREELTTADGEVLHVANKFEARYVLYAQANGQLVAACLKSPSRSRAPSPTTPSICASCAGSSSKPISPVPWTAAWPSGS